MMEDFLESEEFYNAMQRYRVMPMTRQPDVIEAFEAVKTLMREQVAQQAAVIEQMREALQYHMDQTRPIQKTISALALNPSPEVLNKVRAETIRSLYDWFMDQDTFNFLNEAAIETYIYQHIEKGEA